MPLSVLKLWETTPWWGLLLLALPSMLAGGIVWLVISSVGSKGKPRARAIRILHLAIPVASSLAAFWVVAVVATTFGDAPEAVYLVERGGHQRLAVVTERVGRGRSCTIYTWELPEAGWVGGDGRRGECVTGLRGAWVQGYGAGASRALLLWDGRLGPSIDELARREGPLPGAGAIRVTSMGGDRATVALQDGSVRELRWANGDRVTPLAPSKDRYELDAPGVFAPMRLQGPGVDCGCTEPPCGVLVSFDSVAFGDGERSVGLVAPDGSPRLVWSVRAATLFDADSPRIFGVIADGARCVFVAGRSGGRVALAWVNRANGAVLRTVTR